MRYIQLQRVLQSKMAELEKLCIRERQLLEGKWKTHSLPARKKASQNTNGDPPTPTQAAYSYCRPTVSTEDVAKVQQKQQNPPLIFAYQYLDPHYRYMLQPSASSSGEYLLTLEPSRYRGDQHHFIVKTPCDAPPKQNRGNQTNNGEKPKKVHPSNTPSQSLHPFQVQTSCHSYAGHLCNPCMQSGNNADNTSLEAYDLASPCCDPHCVPSSRRRSRNHKDHHRKRDSKTEETQTDPQQPSRSRPHSQVTQTTPSNVQTFSVPRRYFHFGTGLVSQCSLHSCTSSELSAVAPTTVGESSASYTTSLSTDTLYWDGSCDIGASRQLSIKSSSSKHDHQQRYISNQAYQSFVPFYFFRYTQTHSHEPVYVQYSAVKPKSWDNLTTKAFGGYGFGYGYLDTSTKCSKNTNRSQKNQSTQYVRVDKHTSTSSQPQYTPHTHRRYFQPTKSTESLLSVPKYSNEALSDSSVSCECLDASPAPETSENRFFQSPRQSISVSPTDPNFGYYSARRPSKNIVSTSSEATRL